MISFLITALCIIVLAGIVAICLMCWSRTIEISTRRIEMTGTAYDDQFTEHPNDEDYRNRAERAEQECAELLDRLKAAADEINGLKDALAQVPYLADQDADSEIARLREYVDRHDSLITNGPNTIMTLQAQVDRWRDAVADLCRIVDPTVNQLIEAGFEVNVEIADD